MTTVDHWADYFRENPQAVMSYLQNPDGIGVWRHDEALKPVGVRLGVFPTLFEASRVVVAGRTKALAERTQPKIAQYELAL